MPVILTSITEKPVVQSKKFVSMVKQVPTRRYAENILQIFTPLTVGMVHLFRDWPRHMLRCFDVFNTECLGPGYQA